MPAAPGPGPRPVWRIMRHARGYLPASQGGVPARTSVHTYAWSLEEARATVARLQAEADAAPGGNADRDGHQRVRFWCADRPDAR